MARPARRREKGKEKGLALVPGTRAGEERLDRPLFAYGTLADPGFVAQLLGRPVAATPAELLGFARVELAGFAYPILLGAAGERAPGFLYRALRAEDWRRLDAYEGVGEDLYFRDLAEAVPPEGAPGEGEEAWVYLPTGRTLTRYGA